jgi:CheY-like chemotaxis protein
LVSDLLGDQLFGKLNEKQSGYVAEISSAGRHLLRLINDILDLAKVESGKMDISLSPVDLPELLGHCLIMIREMAIKRGLAVDLKVSEQLDGKIQADDVRLKQIVMNLLSNAAKFTPSGGTILLQAERQGEEILVSVSDTGVGLKPDDQESIFQPFEQLDSSFSRQEQGTGLGLALVRKLVELHGGQVWVESEGEGRGSKFKFVFPFIQAEKDMDTQQGPELVNFPSLTLPDFSGEQENHPTVLVVEDNESNMKFTTDLLEAAHYKAIHAFSAEEAIKKAETENPALILMDISLPGMDGLEATRILKRNSATSHIPVIALTAHAMKDNENSAKLAGCDAYLLKPVDTKIFYHTLVALIHSGNENASS